MLFWAPETIAYLSEYQGSEAIYGIFSFQVFLLLFVFLGSFVFPASFIYYLYTIKLLPSLDLNQRQSRWLPYLFSSICYAFIAYLLYQKLPLLVELSLCLAAIAASIFIVFLINFKMKISAHATGMAGMWAAFLSLSVVRQTDGLLLPMVLCSIFTGLVCAARLQLNAHTFKQILAGLAVGLIVASIFVLVFLH
jgi:membrane-associated phospholipid phosphatase